MAGDVIYFVMTFYIPICVYSSYPISLTHYRHGIFSALYGMGFNVSHMIFFPITQVNILIPDDSMVVLLKL